MYVNIINNLFFILLIKMLSDKYLIYPIIFRSDFIYTKLNITPNQITLFSGLIITPIFLINILSKSYITSFFLIQVRNYLDGLDGYIARKYSKTSNLGEIYDHTFDSIFLGIISFLFFNNIIVSYLTSCISIIINFNQIYLSIHFKSIYIIFGNCNEDGYNCILSLILLLIYTFYN